MADKGLVSKSTLQGFADEVRRLAESEQTGTPAEMLALLQAVEAGGFNVQSGKVTQTATSSSKLSLGASLDDSGDYALLVSRHWDNSRGDIKASIIYYGYIVSVGGVTTNYTFACVYKGGTDSTVYYEIGGYKNKLNLTASTGQLTVSAIDSVTRYFEGGAGYAWFFIKG